MAIVKILSSNDIEIITTEMQRVPCVDEMISLDFDYDGSGITRRVATVGWTVCRNNNKAVGANIWIDCEFEQEEADYMKKSYDELADERI